jgi:hypothetical protein
MRLQPGLAKKLPADAQEMHRHQNLLLRRQALLLRFRTGHLPEKEDNLPVALISLAAADLQDQFVGCPPAGT